ncbi:MAG: murein L,D-transpeptidase catalytic domain family protein [Mucilaginibacter sp.]
MRKRFWWVTFALLAFSITVIGWKADDRLVIPRNIPAKTAGASAKMFFSSYIEKIYHTAQLNDAGLEFPVFQKAVTGYFNLKASAKVSQYSSVITVIDLAKSSCTKRMWIIDMVNKNLILNTWVAHGNGSGDIIPDHFSNENYSHASSLGFYVTDNVYNGKHGRSLRLDGLDSGFNDNAFIRGIVIHAAPYVSSYVINLKGRIGRSEGCPAISPKVARKVINTIKGKTVIFISGNDDSYSSKYLDERIAANYVYPVNGDNQ